MADNTEILRRRTFAIIAHPDAGKTSLTEKLLDLLDIASLYGGSIPCFLWNHGRCFLISFLQTAGGKSSLTGGNPGKAYRAYDLCTV